MDQCPTFISVKQDNLNLLCMCRCATKIIWNNRCYCPHGHPTHPHPHTTTHKHRDTRAHTRASGSRLWPPGEQELWSSSFLWGNLPSDLKSGLFGHPFWTLSEKIKGRKLRKNRKAFLKARCKEPETFKCIEQIYLLNSHPSRSNLPSSRLHLCTCLSRVIMLTCVWNGFVSDCLPSEPMLCLSMSVDLSLSLSLAFQGWTSIEPGVWLLHVQPCVSPIWLAAFSGGCQA